MGTLKMVSLHAEGEWIEIDVRERLLFYRKSPSMRREWIEICGIVSS